MASTTTPPDGTPDDDDDEWSATRQVFARPELCALTAEHSDLVGAHRLKGVCRAMHAGAEEYLRTLPKLVVCGGVRTIPGGGMMTTEGWRLDLEKLQWDHMPSLTRKRFHHTCCVVRGRFVVLGGTCTVEISLGSFQGMNYLVRKWRFWDVMMTTLSGSFFRRFHAAPLSTLLRSPSTRARVSWDRCFSSAMLRESSELEAVYRWCTRLTWRLGCVRRYPALCFFLTAIAIQLRACRTGASFARAEITTSRMCTFRMTRSRRM
jgi:hypothetical protein